MEQFRRQLVEDNINLVYYVVHRYGFYKDDEEIAEAEEALVEAAQRFDVTRNVKFSAYATKCIRLKLIAFNNAKRHLIHFRNKNDYCHESYLSLEAEYNLGDSDGSGITLLNVLSKNQGINGDDVIEKIYLKEFWSKLSAREQQILYMRAMGSSQSEIAQQLNLSQVHISRLLTKLKNKYEEY